MQWIKLYDDYYYLFAICNGYYELFHILQDSNKKQIPAIKEATTNLGPSPHKYCFYNAWVSSVFWSCIHMLMLFQSEKKSQCMQIFCHNYEHNFHMTTIIFKYKESICTQVQIASPTQRSYLHPGNVKPQVFHSCTVAAMVWSKEETGALVCAGSQRHVFLQLFVCLLIY